MNENFPKMQPLPCRDGKEEQFAAAAMDISATTI
jgi:hypothetical protein